jgi:ABC-type bacteriocin/lantibiotic exporter with double-glycine peptidase domain
MKIQTKISSLVLLVTLATGAVAITLSALVSKHMIETKVYEHLETAAASRTHHIETLLDEEMELTKVLATAQTFIRSCHNQKRRICQSKNKNFDFNL